MQVNPKLNSVLDTLPKDGAAKYARAVVAARLNASTWQVVKTNWQDLTTYQRACRAAEVVELLVPGDGSYLNTLGVAQYRSGQFQEAIQTLRQAEQVWGTPLNLAYLAMCHARLHESQLASQCLADAQSLVQSSFDWDNDGDVTHALSEAHEVVTSEGSLRSDSAARVLPTSREPHATR
jgi:Flp pilus assembly protein TadD